MSDKEKKVNLANRHFYAILSSIEEKLFPPLLQQSQSYSKVPNKQDNLVYSIINVICGFNGGEGVEGNKSQWNDTFR